MLMRVKDAVDMRMRENKARFRKGCSCQDQIFCLNQTIEKCVDQQLPCLINFIDFKAAFDSVHRPSLWKIIHYYIPQKIINIIKSSYRNTSCSVRSDRSLSDWFQIVAGVRQGDIWSPLLFGLAIDFVMRCSVDAKGTGLTTIPRCSFKVPSWKAIWTMQMTLLCLKRQKRIWQKMVICKSASKLGLMMSFKKTETMSIGHHSNNDPTVHCTSWWWREYKSCRSFKYLGAYSSSDGTNTKEPYYRLGKAAGIFRELDKIWKNRYINLPTKMQFYNACVLSTLLYGAECWTLKDKDKYRLDAFDMRCQRKNLKTRWSQYVTNINIRKKTNQPQLSNVIKKCLVQWFGHLQRMDVTWLSLKLYRWTPYHGNRKPGRPRTTWKDIIKCDLDSLMTGWTLEEAEVAAKTARSGGIFYVRQQVHRCTMLFDDDDEGGWPCLFDHGGLKPLSPPPMSIVSILFQLSEKRLSSKAKRPFKSEMHFGNP